MTIITQGRKPSKVMGSKQIMGTADHKHPPRTVGFKAFVCVIHHTYKGFHTSLQQATM
jgi:hypothetical protein